MIEIACEAEMLDLGRRIACVIKQGDVLLLNGDLGVGKTFLARSIIREWLGDLSADVPSPSFTLVQNYQSGEADLNHFDLYRLGSLDELIELGLPDLFNHAISIVEWPERLGVMMPDDAIHIEILDRGGEAREVKMRRGEQVWML